VFEKIVPSKTVTIMAVGPMLHEAVKAAEKMTKVGLGAVVVNPSIVNHPDLETLNHCLNLSDGYLVTAEDHQLVGGMGAQITHVLLRKGVRLKLASLGVNDEFGQSAYKASELYQKHGIDAEAIEKAAVSLLIPNT
ncbi:MAG: transketolase, partial [Bdellovibrionales bacterium]|nr:transketolase [Bdellovibrionales bacterium]